MDIFLKRQRHITEVLIIVLAVLCWWKLLILEGLWWDDWAWTWHFFSSDNLSEFIQPFKSLRHVLAGYILFVSLKLFDILPEMANFIWNLCKFIVFIGNALLLYCILKKLLHFKSKLPQAISIVYLASPVISNLCLVMLPYHLFLFTFLFSIFFSVKSLDTGKFRIFYYLLSISCSLISMFGLETFVFFELSRPVIIFYMSLGKIKNQLFSIIRKTLIYWLPFIAMGIFILLYGIGWIKPRFGPYAHTYAFRALSIPEYICHIINAYKNALFYLFAGNAFYFLKRTLLMVREYWNLMLSLISALFALLIIFRKQEITREGDSEISYSLNEAKFVTIFGLFLTFIGLLPYTIIHFGTGFGVGSRHALLANVGVSVFIPSFLFLLYYKGLIKKLFYQFLFGSFIFLGIFQNNHAIKAYSNDWQQQRSFWWQLIWRVPDIKDKTFLVIDIPRYEFDYFGDWRASYEFSGPLNLFFAHSGTKKELNSHFVESVTGLFDLNDKINWDYFYLTNINKEEAVYRFYRGDYKYYPKNLIVAVLHNRYVYLNKDIVTTKSTNRVNIEPLLANSSDNQLIYKTDNLTFPFRWIIGPEPKKLNELTVMDKIKDRIFHRTVHKDWRYYLQTTKMLEDRRDYKGVIELYKEAEKLGILPPPPETIPLFIVKSFYLMEDINKGNYLLWVWALSSEGNLKKALNLVESIKAINDDQKLIADIKKEIRHIWGTLSLN